MDVLMLISSATVALTLILAWTVPALRDRAAKWSVLIPVLSLIWSVTTHHELIDVRWLLLGSRFGLDATGQIFMGVTAVLWLAATVYGRAYFHDSSNLRGYHLFFLLTMVGNLGLIIAQDVASYLTFYTLMSVAAYGLIVHDRKVTSIRAGKIYIIMTVLGEMLLFVGLAIAVRDSTSTLFDDLRPGIASSDSKGLITILILCGFGIKLGIMPLHIWLPLAHPAAPTPASAVLSGAMIKTGLLGMIRVLPFGILGFESIGIVVIVAGLVTAFLAALIGTTQTNAKSVLAYSSSSQMGLVAVGLGVGLLHPEAWSVILPALLFFVVHHAIAKAALFFGYGVISATTVAGPRRTAVLVGLGISSLAIAGLPLTTGYSAKNALKSGVTLASAPWGHNLEWLLPLTSITTTMVMARFLYLVWSPAKTEVKFAPMGLVLPWVILTAGVLTNGYFGIAAGFVDSSWMKWDAKYLVGALWPMGLAGVAIGLTIKFRKLREFIAVIRVPAGDILNLLPPLYNPLRDAAMATVGRLVHSIRARSTSVNRSSPNPRFHFHSKSLSSTSLETIMTTLICWLSLILVLLFGI